MLRYQPSKVELTLDELERAGLRIKDRKKITTIRHPPSSRLSTVVSPQRATVRRGSEQSRDDAVIHSDRASPLRSFLHAEYVSLLRNSTSLNQHATKDCAGRRRSDSFSDSTGSISVDASPLPALHRNSRHFKGHRVCSNPLSMLRLTAQQPAVKDTSATLSSSPNLRSPSRHTRVDNSAQGVTSTLSCSETHPTSDLLESPWSAWETFAHQFVRCLNRGDLAALPKLLRTHKSHFPEAESADGHLVEYINRYFGLDYPTTTLTPIPYDNFRDIIENAVACHIMVLDRTIRPYEINMDPAEYIFIGDSAISTTHHARAPPKTHGSAAHAAEGHATFPLDLLQSNLRELQGSVASTRPERPVSEYFEPFHQQMRPISLLPRSDVTPATTLHDQENSESAAMSVLSADILHFQAHNTGSTDDGIMDDTPPRETRLTRYFQG